MRWVFWDGCREWALRQQLWYEPLGAHPIMYLLQLLQSQFKWVFMGKLFVIDYLNGESDKQKLIAFLQNWIMNILVRMLDSDIFFDQKSESSLERIFFRLFIFPIALMIYGLFYYNRETQLMTAHETVKFQLEEYYDVLMSANVKEKLKPFVREFKRRNTTFIYQTIVNTIQVITGKHEIPLMKFNALMATKLFFDTGEYVPIVLIEIYLLPIIFEISCYRIQKRSEEGLTLYFIEKGYDSTKEMKRLGFNYVLLAIEFLFMSAQVKPYRSLQNNQLKEDSNYTKISKILQERGLQMPDNYKFYIPSYVKQTRKKYMKRLAKFTPEEYTEFFLKLICDEVNKNKKPQLEMKKLFVYGDAYITIPLMHICEDQLNNMQSNFVNKKKYLNLIGEFMKLGDIYAVLIVTRSTFLQSIFKEVQKVKGEVGFEAGEGIYPKIEAAKSDKKQFYIEYLKHIEIWATCHPIDEDGNPTDAKEIFDALKNQNKFVFPSNILVNKIRAQMQTNLKLNQKRNEKFIKLVDETNSQQSRKKINSSFRDSKMKQPSSGLRLNSYIQFDQIEQKVLQAKKNLDLIIDKANIDKTLKSLQKFKIFWQNNAQKNEIQADDSGDIEIVLQEGDLCVKIIEMVQPIYQLYSKNLISFEEYKERVDILMKKQAQQSEKQVSFENNLPSSSSKGSSVEKFQDCYEKSSLSELHSNIKQSSIKVSNQIQEVPSKQEESRPPSSNQNNVMPNQSQLSKKSKGSGKIDNSNISFKEESLASSKSNKEKNSQKSRQNSQLQGNISFENVKSSSVFRSPPQRSSIIDSKISKKSENQQKSQSKLSDRSNKSGRSGGSFRKLGSRNKNQLSNNSQSLISEQQIKYQDVIAKRKAPKSGYEDYYEGKQSFISSQKSESERPSSRVRSREGDKMSSSRSRLRLRQKKEENNQYGLKDNNYKSSQIQEYYGQVQSSVEKVSFIQVSENSMKTPIQSSNKMQGSRMTSKVNQSSVILQQNIQNVENSCSQSLMQAPQAINPALSKLKQSNKPILTKILNPNNQALTFSYLDRYQQQVSAIHQPEYDPLLYSFHEQKSMDLTNPSKVTSFKECLSINNEIIPAKQGKEKLFKFTKNGKISNFIQTAYPRQTPKNSTIIDILSERNAKRSIECYRNQREKSRATQTLSERMKSMQSFNKNMRMKIIMKNQQSRNQQVNLLKTSRNSRNNGSQPVSFYNDTQSQALRSENNLKSEAGQVKYAQLLNQSRQINPKIYNHYFPTVKTDKYKKCMLKSKSLLLKNEQFEIGFVANKKQKSIDISLFFTPLKATIQDLNLSIMNDHNLKAKLYNNFIDEIKQNQQQYINIEFQVQNVPYVIPTLNIKFKTNRHYQNNQMLLPIPIGFNKFFTFHPSEQDYFNPSTSKKNTHNNEDVITSDGFKYSSKLLNCDRIKQSLQQFALIKKQNKVAYYGSEGYYRGKIFFLRFEISDRGEMTLEGKNMTGDHKNTKFLQFLLITFRQIFEGKKKQVQK